MRWFVFIFILFPCLSFTQNSHIDSLIELAEEKKNDTARAHVYNIISNEFLEIDTRKAIEYARKALELSEENKSYAYMDDAYKNMVLAYFYEGNYDSTLAFNFMRLELAEKTGNNYKEADINNNIGKIYYYQGDYEKAFQYFLKSNEISKKLGDKEGLSATFLTLGAIYYEQGNYEKALDNYFQSLNNAEALSDTGVMSYVSVNIGHIYKEQEKYKEALEYYKKTMQFQEAIDEQQGMISTYNSLANIYSYLDQYDTSEFYYTKALELSNSLNNNRGLGMTYNNLGSHYLLISNKLKERGLEDSASVFLNKSLQYYENSLRINKQIGEYEEIILANQGLGDVYFNLGNYRQAISYLQKAKEMAEESGSPYGIKEAARSLHETYASIEDYKNAYQEHKIFKKMVDSLKNEEKVEAITQLAMQYQFDKKQKQIEFEHQSELRRKRWIQRISISGLVIVMLFAMVLYRSYKRKQKDNKLLAQQKAQIEEQKQSITDSIIYAQRIQKAILPSEEYIENILKDYFILFKPRDIVSGDFYWMSQKNGKTYVVAADCTGHGVPGAFMSMLGVSFLNEIVNKSETDQCNLILERLREYVIASLHQTGKEGEAKDGMDLSMFILDSDNHEIQYSGANNPLYVVREMSEEEKKKNETIDEADLPRGVVRSETHELHQLRPDKMPIGIHVKHGPFTNHKVKVSPGSSIYAFSDGFIDQFGGPKNKKYMAKPFKRLILSIQDKDMTKQKEILDNTIVDWMITGNKHQVDDILVIGVKI
jgi:tetratricopeptide (TPR) repeat protein